MHLEIYVIPSVHVNITRPISQNKVYKGGLEINGSRLQFMRPLLKFSSLSTRAVLQLSYNVWSPTFLQRLISVDSTLIKRCKSAVLPTGAVDKRKASPRKSRASGTWSVVQSLKAVTARLTSAQLPHFGFVEECCSEVLGSVVTMSDNGRERAGVATGEMTTFGSGARESAQPHGLHDGGSAPPQCQTRENQKSALIYSLSAPPTSGWITARVCSDHQQYRVLVRPQNTSSLFWIF